MSVSLLVPRYEWWGRALVWAKSFFAWIPKSEENINMPANYNSSPITVRSDGGETRLTIVLELNINVTSSGGVEASVTARPSEKDKKVSDTLVREEKFDYAIPDFSSGGDTIDFGKKVD